MQYIAADFGAGSGRVMIGTIKGDNLTLEEIHRFPNRMIRIGDLQCWDFPFLLQELKNGIKKAVEKYDDVVSVGIDTWGVDFGLIGEKGHLIGNPVCYRDERTNGISRKFFQTITAGELYKIAGT